MLTKMLLRKAMIGSLGILTITGLAACSSTAEPQDRQFDLTIEHGAIELESGVITVTQGDNVSMNFSSDEDGLVHLHGYDIEQSVGPEGTLTIEFVADATGRYNFTFHKGDDEHEDSSYDEHDAGVDAHAELFESSTLIMGDVFEFEVPHDLHDASIPFHNHMSHDVTGHIMVDEHAAYADEVSIEVNSDGSFTPEEVMVRPGTTVVWVNQGEDRARISSGNPPTAAPEESDEHEEHEADEEEGHEDDDDEDEVTLGALEVMPR
jgi:plastocyanin